MTSGYQRLMEDHRNMTTLLRYVRSQVSKYDRPDEEPDLPMVLTALEYIDQYPEISHHPLEEAAFDYLIERHLGNKQAIDLLREQHQELTRETHELIRLFEMIFDDHAVPVARIKSALNGFLDLQFQHMEDEESLIFPAMREALTDADWIAIGKSVELRQDPLFHATPPVDFQQLSNELQL